jgi:thiol-disulfide isomerase/thioredoxin
MLGAASVKIVIRQMSYGLPPSDWRTMMTGRRLLRVVVCLLAVFPGIAAHGRAEDTARTFAELKQQHELKAEAINRRWVDARTDAEREALQAEVWKEIKSAASRAFAWAEAHPDDPDAIDAIVWTVHGLANGYYPEYADEIARAYELLTTRAIASEKVAPVCYYTDSVAIASPQAKHFLETALKKSPSRLVRGAACLGLARSDHTLARLARRSHDPITRKPLTDRWAKTAGFLERLETVDPDALDRRAVEYFDRVAAEYGDVKLPSPYNETPFAELARGEVYALLHLGEGKKAPGLEGEDVRGGKLRLSDYRGKVVAIVFWATWCGPCMAMVPHERELVKRMEGKPFVLLGINGDDDRAAALKVMAEQSMTWPSVWNGGKLDGIVAAWGVRSWPTVYVLDAAGVIRYDGLRGEYLDKAVDRLVAEAEAARR